MRKPRGVIRIQALGITQKTVPVFDRKFDIVRHRAGIFFESAGDPQRVALGNEPPVLREYLLFIERIRVEITRHRQKTAQAEIFRVRFPVHVRQIERVAFGPEHHIFGQRRLFRRQARKAIEKIFTETHSICSFDALRPCFRAHNV